MDLDDGNDSLESMSGHCGGIKGAGMNSDVYDVYSNPSPRLSYFFHPISPLSSIVPSVYRATYLPATPHLRHMLRSATRRKDSPLWMSPATFNCSAIWPHSQPAVPRPPWHCIEIPQIQLLDRLLHA